jgi:hypothetical protein
MDVYCLIWPRRWELIGECPITVVLEDDRRSDSNGSNSNEKEAGSSLPQAERLA